MGVEMYSRKVRVELTFRVLKTHILTTELLSQDSAQEEGWKLTNNTYFLQIKTTRTNQFEYTLILIKKQKKTTFSIDTYLQLSTS